MICDRCGEQTRTFTMSMFNEEMICKKCKEEERKHKDYERAREEELQQVRDGNYNFKGIGKPSDL